MVKKRGFTDSCRTLLKYRKKEKEKKMHTKVFGLCVCKKIKLLERTLTQGSHTHKKNLKLEIQYGTTMYYLFRRDRAETR